MATLKTFFLRALLALIVVVAVMPHVVWALAGDSSSAVVEDVKPQYQALSAEVEQEITRAAQDVATLHSDFVQEKYLSMFEEKLRSTGKFFYQRPDLLRWELLTPIASGFVIKGDGGRRWNQSVAGSETFKLNQDKAMALIAQQLFAWAKADLPWLRSHYTITMATRSVDPGKAKEQPIQLRLVPPAETGGFLSYLLITFAADASYVSTVEIHESDGDYTIINFNNTVVNDRIPKEIFTGRMNR